MLSGRAVALQGVGFGPLAMALQGFSPIESDQVVVPVRFPAFVRGIPPPLAQRARIRALVEREYYARLTAHKQAPPAERALLAYFDDPDLYAQLAARFAPGGCLGPLPERAAILAQLSALADADEEIPTLTARRGKMSREMMVRYLHFLREIA